MRKLEALLFDVDGTLVDTEELHRQAFNEAFLRFDLGWCWDRDRYAELLRISGGAERIAHHIDTLDAAPAEKLRLRRLLPGLHREKTRLYGELQESSAARLRPGVRRLIDGALAAGLRIGLASTSALANVQPMLLASLGVETCSRIGGIVGADLVTRKKPAPDLYELLLTMLAVPAAAAVAFEDSANGLVAAKSASLYTVVTPTAWTQAQPFPAADLLLPSLGDPDQPLPSDAAARIGGASYLDLPQLEMLRGRAGPAATRH